MVSSSPAQQHHNKKDDAGCDRSHRLSKSAVSLVPGPKPLSKHKFYLDVKNHITWAKLEAKIKELGGVLELFLVQEVTHVLTDREEWSSGIRGAGSLPRTPRTPQQNASPSNQRRNTPVRGRPKTRADAMLERARNNTPPQQEASKEILEQAKIWGIPVWSIEKSFAWLDKVVSSLVAEKQKPRKKCKIVDLKAPYVKFEAFDRRHRPVFKEIRNWPTFNFKGEAGSAAVLHKTAGAQIMTKSRALSQRKKVCVLVQSVQSGYCELCREEYQNLEEHIESKKHLAYITNNDNFLELDSIIHDGTDLESFLKKNDTNCNGLVDSRNNCSFALHKMPRTRTSSINDCNINKVKNAPISPAASESGHRLRTRKANMTFIGFTAQEQEDNGFQIKPEGAREIRELRSATKIHMKSEESLTWNSGRPKRACIRQKRNSFLEETGLSSEQRGYYKIEMTPKLRSSAPSATYKESHIPVPVIKKSPILEQTEPSEQYEDNKSLIFKFKRMRSSELRQLNNEAENFLFPKKDDSSSEDDIDADCRDTTVSNPPGDSIVISSETDTENDDEDEVIEVVTSSCEQSEQSECKRRKRLTQAEAFIEDNKKYYKFETPGSRLRYHGTTLTNHVQSSPRKGRVNGNLGDNETREIELTTVKQDCDNKVCTKRENCKFTLDELQFSFETIPKSEPWYETFSRQDQGAEYYTCFSDSGYWKPFLLPYQMERIQPLDPKVCIQTYTQIKKLLTSEISSGSNSTPTCSTPDSGSPAPIETDETSKASEDSNLNAVHQSKATNSLQRPTTKRKKRNAIVPRNPRKSPRQHASTLAILSSLIQHRKKRKTSSPNNTLDSIPEGCEQEESTRSEEKPVESMHKVAESIDDMLTNAFGDLEQVEMLPQDEDEMLEFSCKSDAIEILQDYENYKHVDRKTGLIGASRRCYSPGKKPGRKKKKNRTGWPKNSVKRNLNNTTNKSIIGDDDSAQDEAVDEETHDTVNNDLCANVHSNKISDSEDYRVSTHAATRPLPEMMESSLGSIELEKWENAEKVLSAKIANEANKEQALLQSTKEADDVKFNNRRLRSSSSPPRNRSNGVKRARRMPASPKSPRVLRKPRGRWYRER